MFEVCYLICANTKSRVKTVVIVEWVLITIFAILLLLYGIFNDKVVEYFTKLLYKANPEFFVFEFVGISRTRKVTEADAARVEEKIKRYKGQLREIAKAVYQWYLIIFIVAVFLRLANIILLTLAVRRKNVRLCKIWCIVNMILFVLGLIGTFFQLIQMFRGLANFLNILVEVCSLAWLAFSLGVLKKFKEKLTRAQVKVNDTDETDDEQDQDNQVSAPADAENPKDIPPRDSKNQKEMSVCGRVCVSCVDCFV